MERLRKRWPRWFRLCRSWFGHQRAATRKSEAAMFRLPRDRALINRAGFNNCGAEQLANNIKRRRPDCVLGVNIGKSRRIAIDDAIPDYLETFAAVYDVADYVAVNVSSPNTPNLRELQRPEMLRNLLESLQERNAGISPAIRARQTTTALAEDRAGLD